MALGLWDRLAAGPRGLAALGRDAGLRRGLWVFLFLVAAAALFASVTLPSEVDLRAGQVAPVTIKSPRDMVDQPATAAARQSAAAQVQPSYAVDASLVQNQLAAFDSGTRAIDAARMALLAPPVAASGPAASGSTAGAGAATAAAEPPSTSGAASSASGPAPGESGSSAAAVGSSSTSASGSPTPAAVAAAAASLRSALDLSLPDPDYVAVLEAPQTEIDTAAAAARQDLAAALQAGVLEDQSQLEQARQALGSAIAGLQVPAAVDRMFAALASRALVPDRFVDDQATAAAQQAAEEKVSPITIARGQVIVREGDLVTPADIARLRAAGLLRPGGTFGVLASAGLLSLLLLALCWAFLAQFHRRALHDELHLVLFGSVIVGALAGARLGLPLSPYLAPVAWSAMLASVAFGPGVALFVSGIAGLACGLLVHDLGVAVAGVTGAWTAVFSLRRLQQRSELLRAGLYAGLAQAAAAVLLTGLVLGQSSALSGALLSPISTSSPVLRAVAASAFIGLLSGVLAIGTLPYAEALGVLTPFRLLELANPGQPLLRRLLVEAPGTYHHSLMVANLAEAACQAAGGDALLVRAGAYYHDIGKMKRPVFFVENQLGGENPHDKLSPQLSVLVITSHVRDGVELARQARLPEEIVDFIRTHHGTTLVRYFYNAARRETRLAGTPADRDPDGPAPGTPGGAASASPGGALPVSEEDFRYEGPLPSSRETAIVMLADGVEAAVRAQPHPTADDIEGVISRIITDRLEDGQLDDAALTFKDLHSISVTFRRILLGAYHARVEYPAALADEVRPAALRAAAQARLGPPPLPPGPGA